MMSFLPSVIRAEYCDHFRIHLTFNDNTEKTIDFHQWLRGPIFEPLKDLTYFRRFFLDGGTVAWPNGADIAPETLYQASSPQPRRPNTGLQPTASRTKRSAGSRTVARSRRLKP
jgi:hypothetical protein